MRGTVCIAAAVGMSLLALAAPASASHVACGNRITATTTLDSDVVCGPGQQTGLFIAADNVTLWTEGHSITSTATSDGVIGISAHQVSGVDIRGGGTITGFSSSIGITGSDSSVRGMTVTPAGGGFGIAMRGAGNYVYRNVVVGEGISVIGADAYVWGNTARYIQTDGDNPRVVLNTVSCLDFPGSRGITVNQYTTAAVASMNDVTGCTFGIRAGAATLEQSGNGRFRRNQVHGNDTGLLVYDGSAIIGRNTANDNLDTGIASAVAGTLIQNNTANNNPLIGINAAVGTIDGGGNIATGNLQNCVNVSCP